MQLKSTHAIRLIEIDTRKSFKRTYFHLYTRYKSLTKEQTNPCFTNYTGAADLPWPHDMSGKHGIFLQPFCNINTVDQDSSTVAPQQDDWHVL